jgi:hypothetical protein
MKTQGYHEGTKTQSGSWVAADDTASDVAFIF